VDCFIGELRRLEKLGYCRLIVECDCEKQALSVMIRIADAFEAPTLQGDGVRSQGRTELSRKDI